MRRYLAPGAVLPVRKTSASQPSPYSRQEGPNDGTGVDPGEREAIALALDFHLPLLIEEEAGRTLARELGIRISGIAGPILQAVREGIIGAGRANRMLVALKKKGRINQQVFESVKNAVEEEA